MFYFLKGREHIWNISYTHETVEYASKNTVVWWMHIFENLSHTWFVFFVKLNSKTSSSLQSSVDDLCLRIKFVFFNWVELLKKAL